MLHRFFSQDNMLFRNDNAASDSYLLIMCGCSQRNKWGSNSPCSLIHVYTLPCNTTLETVRTSRLGKTESVQMKEGWVCAHSSGKRWLFNDILFNLSSKFVWFKADRFHRKQVLASLSIEKGNIHIFLILIFLQGMLTGIIFLACKIYSPLPLYKWDTSGLSFLLTGAGKGAHRSTVTSLQGLWENNGVAPRRSPQISEAIPKDVPVTAMHLGNLHRTLLAKSGKWNLSTSFL